MLRSLLSRPGSPGSPGSPAPRRRRVTPRRRSAQALAILAGAVLCVSVVASCGRPDDIATPGRTIPGAPPCEPKDAVVPPEGKPTVAVPEGAAPTALEKTDIKTGDGREATPGDKVFLQYVGAAKSTGKEFDSSWDRGGKPLDFVIGPGAAVVPGFNQGAEGMKVGGRRQIVIPPDLGYGATGSGSVIAPNETLIFVVDLVQVCPPNPLAPTTVPASSTTANIIPPESSTPASTPDSSGASSTTSAVPSSTTTAAPGSSSTPPR
jgi:peptidylprolyl isomerase